MTDGQFAAYAVATCEDYARTSPHYRDRPFAEADADVRAGFAKRLPEGPRTPGTYLLAILLSEGGAERQIGYLDIAENPLGSKSTYIYNIGLNEDVRGRGYGKSALALTEVFLRDRGYTKIGLNVFAGNAIARKIYDDAGFTITQMNMEKKL